MFLRQGNFLNACLPLNPGAYPCWDEVSFVYGIGLITKESKQGVTIVLLLGLAQHNKVILWNCKVNRGEVEYAAILMTNKLI